MTDLREVFPILRDDSTNEGEAPVSRIEGEVAAGKEGLIGFSYKNNVGNVVLVQLTSEGKVPVDTENTGGTCLTDNGEFVAGSLTNVDIATIVGTVTKINNRFEVIASSLRSSLWSLFYIDDAGGSPVETLLSQYVTGPGAFTICCETKCLEHDTTGGTGTQNFILRGRNFTHLSSLRATLSYIERDAS